MVAPALRSTIWSHFLLDYYSISARATFSNQASFTARTGTTRNFSRIMATAKNTPKRSGTSVVWFRNDLRVHDNESLLLAWQSSEVVLPIFCFDPLYFGETDNFGFPKTGAFRSQFLIEAVEALRHTLQERGSNLVVRRGKPEDVIPGIVAETGALKVFAQRETCEEETRAERKVAEALRQIPLAERRSPKLELTWGSTLYHIDDLPFTAPGLPDVYTQFRKGVESNSRVRPPLKMPEQLGPLPDAMVQKIGGLGSVPTVEDLGVTPKRQDGRGVMHFRGGEGAALARLNDYFWEKNLLRVYKETRNGMLGADYSSKFSPWLALGCLSPRAIHAEVLRYEKARVANESTYWLLFELLWRDYFRFLALKCGNSIFHLGGPQKAPNKHPWSQDQALFATWQNGTTGYPLVDANMRELKATGFMSNRGRQIVCSFLTRDLGVDWRMGAEWFESELLDYDPASNYGNWTYGAGVGTDPREDRYFSIPKQAQSYDPEGKYVSHWIPELAKLPQASRHFPHRMSPSEKALHGWTLDEAYPPPVVPLKFGSAGGGSSGGGRGRGRGGRGSSGDNRKNRPSGSRGRGASGQSARF